MIIDIKKVDTTGMETEKHKGDFVGGIHHEVKSLIDGGIVMQTFQPNEKLPSDVKDYLKNQTKE